MRLFKIRQRIVNPRVIIADGRKTSGDSKCIEAIKTGVHYLVTPITQNDVHALQIAEHQVDKFAPVKTTDQTGNGVIVTAEFLAKLDA